MSIAAGIQYFGCVKTVENVSIVTRFVMFQFLPMFPLRSYYRIGQETTQWKGIPGIAGTSTTTINSIELAKLDTLSTAYSYIRAICAAITLMGSIFGIVFGVVYIEHALGMTTSSFRPVEGGWLLLQIAIAVFVAAGAIGLTTYLVPSINRRDLVIRRCCGEVLGYCIDPARILPSIAGSMEESIKNLPDQAAISAVQNRRLFQTRELAQIRCQLAYAEAIDKPKLEAETDRLLIELGNVASE